MFEVIFSGVNFSSAHFLPYYEGKCARLHGHTYNVEVRVAGNKNEEEFVIDFAKLKEIVKSVIDPLDHKVLLGGICTHGDFIERNEQTGMLKYCYNVCLDSDKQIKKFDYIEVPIDFCKILYSVQHTTVENLAKYIHDRLKEHKELKEMHVSVNINETSGQSASYCGCDNYTPN